MAHLRGQGRGQAAECRHKEIAAVRDTTLLTVETVADHGYATGNQVKVSGNLPAPGLRQRDLDHHA
jgi:hypothetical protein